MQVKGDQKGFGAAGVAIVILMVSVVGISGWYVWQSKREADKKVSNSTSRQATPQKSEETKTVENLNKTFEIKDIPGVSMRHDDRWVPEKSIQGFSPSALIKTVGSRSYRISFQKNDSEYLAKDGAYANDLKLFKDVSINGKSHYVAISQRAANAQHAYLSSCPIQIDEACSLKLSDGFLFVSLNQEVPNAQYPVELDFSREDDKRILEEFVNILSTLKY